MDRSATEDGCRDLPSWAVHRARLLDIERLAIGMCFDPDCRPQRAMLLAVDRCEGELFFEVFDSLESGVCLRLAAVTGDSLHAASLLSRVVFGCSIGHSMSGGTVQNGTDYPVADRYSGRGFWALPKHAQISTGGHHVEAQIASPYRLPILRFGIGVVARSCQPARMHRGARA
jgi:hypothetical protein